MSDDEETESLISNKASSDNSEEDTEKNEAYNVYESLFNVKVMLYFVVSNRKIPNNFLQDLLWLAPIVDLGCLTTILVFTFMGLVTSIDYYFSFFFHLPHAFSWVFALNISSSKCYDPRMYQFAMTIYGFLFLCDIIGFIWRVISWDLCNAADPASLCAMNGIYGLVGWILSLALALWSLFVAVQSGLSTGAMMSFTRNSKMAQEKILETKNTISEVYELKDQPSEKDAQEIFDLYKQISATPISPKLFRRRFVLSISIVLELIFIIALIIIHSLGLVISPLFMWLTLLNVPHIFTWAFLLTSISYQYSKKWIRATLWLYIINLVADGVAIVWRAVLLAQCDPSINVDCVFRVFPGWTLIYLLTVLLFVLDFAVLFTLSRYYGWVFERIWKKADALKKILKKRIERMKNTSYGLSNNLELLKRSELSRPNPWPLSSAPPTPPFRAPDLNTNVDDNSNSNQTPKPNALPSNAKGGIYKASKSFQRNEISRKTKSTTNPNRKNNNIDPNGKNKKKD